MLVDNANSIDETFKILGLSKKEIEAAKRLHETAVDIDNKKLGGGIDKKIYVNRRRKVNRTKKIKGGSGVGSALKLSGYIVNYYYLSHIGLLYRAAFGFAWTKIVDVLDNYIDGKILDNTILTSICEYFVYLLPFKLLEYFIDVVKIDATTLAADTAKQLAATGAATGATVSGATVGAAVGATAAKLATETSIDLTLNTAANGAANLGASVQHASKGVALGSLVTDVKGMFIFLYDMAVTSVVNHPYMATGIVLSLPIIAFMGYYLKIRVSGSKDKNLDLDKTIYMNHKRRILIMKAQLRKASKKENEIRREEKEYDLKLQQQIEEGKKEEHVEESKKRKRQWHKFVKRGFDENELYQQNDFLTDSKRSTRRKKNNDKDDDKSFLDREEKHAKDENKS